MFLEMFYSDTVTISLSNQNIFMEYIYGLYILELNCSETAILDFS